jgi:hypothetical protein
MGDLRAEKGEEFEKDVPGRIEIRSSDRNALHQATMDEVLGSQGT